MIVKISYDLIDAWESWKIEIPDPAEEVTAEWIIANKDKWEYIDLADRGGEADFDNLEVYE